MLKSFDSANLPCKSCIHVDLSCLIDKAVILSYMPTCHVQMTKVYS